jgi:acyl carrier protein
MVDLVQLALDSRPCYRKSGSPSSDFDIARDCWAAGLRRQFPIRLHCHEYSNGKGTMETHTSDGFLKLISEETGAANVTVETKLEDLGIDSLDFIDLMLKLNVPDAKIAGLETVGDILKAIE